VRLLPTLLLPLALLLPACIDSEPAAPDPCATTKASAQEQADTVNRAREDKDSAPLGPERDAFEAEEDAATVRLSEIIVATPDCFPDEQVSRAEQLLDAQR
jgi:hypothetical protein